MQFDCSGMVPTIYGRGKNYAVMKNSEVSTIQNVLRVAINRGLSMFIGSLKNTLTQLNNKMNKWSVKK